MSAVSYAKTVGGTQCRKLVRVLLSRCQIDSPCDYTAISITYKGLTCINDRTEIKRNGTNSILRICIILGRFYQQVHQRCLHVIE